MKFSTSLSTFGLLAPAALAAPAARPAVCSSTSITPCTCPNGTSYQQSVTFAVIGAAATDVFALISDFYKIDWLGIPPSATEGPDNKPGAIRIVNVPTTEGTYVFKEELTQLTSTPNGSFTMKFQMLPSTIPLEFASKNGSFAGYWVTLDSDSVFQHETSLVWSVYACSTGHPEDFAAFHESSLANATSILQAEGKVLGSSVKPFSIQAF